LAHEPIVQLVRHAIHQHPQLVSRQLPSAHPPAEVCPYADENRLWQLLIQNASRLRSDPKIHNNAGHTKVTWDLL
jgi:hypothetical protein